MRLPVRCLEITTVERARREMERIGVDPAGIRIMAPKQFHYNLLVEGLTPAQANVLKQDALAIGGEAAVAKGAASCSVERTDAVISGTLKELDLLAGKLKSQSFGLSRVGAAIREALDNLARRTLALETRTRAFSIGPRTLVMGILNVTPDSFSDGGAYVEPSRALDRALEMIDEGADWIDVGGESTRPGATPVPAEEELRRVAPVVEALAVRGVVVSVDTMKAAVAKATLDAGAEIINDVSALAADPGMAGVCAGYGAAVVLMHMRGTPGTMQSDTSYADLMGEVFNCLDARLEAAEAAGIKRERTIIDPGIGFGKSAEGSLELIRRLSELRTLGRPILSGPSRKSFVGKLTGAEAGGRLAGTLSAVTASIMNGASIVRVHDVKEARQACMVADAVKGAGL